MRISREKCALLIMVGQNQLENVEYLKYLGNKITNDARCTCKIKYRIVMAKAEFNRKKAFFTSKLGLNSREKKVKCCIWSITLCGAEIWTFQKLDQKYQPIFEMWCWRRM